MQEYQMYVGGASIEHAGGEWIDSFDPYTGKPWARIPKGNSDDVDRAVAAASAAFNDGDWPKLTATARGRLLCKLGDLIAENAERLAAIEVRDNGKLLAEMLGQLRYIPQWYYYFGGLADKIEGSSRAPSTLPDTNRSGWSPPSPPGTRRCCSSPGSSRLDWQPATRSS